MNILQLDVIYDSTPRYTTEAPSVVATGLQDPFSMDSLLVQKSEELESVYTRLVPSNFVQNSIRVPLSSQGHCQLKGYVQENGKNVEGRYIPVLLITTHGLTLQKTVTNSEGYFIFRQVPLDMAVLVIAVDTTYKYNAVVLANIKTLESNYDQSEV